MKFLTANWEDLIVINYKVNKEVLLPFLPKGTELDDFENKLYVSLIGFMFRNTRVLGVKVPFHVNFEEVNLRFYVKNEEGERGVVFVKEIVPKTAIKTIANSFFNEHYSVSKMNSYFEKSKEGNKVSYEWEEDGVSQFMKVKTKSKQEPIIEGTKSEFIAEHYLGFTKINEVKTSSYKVGHPRWKQAEVTEFEMQVDFELNYGKQFSLLNKQEPDSVFFYKGSDISVSNKQVLK